MKIYAQKINYVLKKQYVWMYTIMCSMLLKSIKCKWIEQKILILHKLDSIFNISNVPICLHIPMSMTLNLIIATMCQEWLVNSWYQYWLSCETFHRIVTWLRQQMCTVIHIAPILITGNGLWLIICILLTAVFIVCMDVMISSTM